MQKQPKPPVARKIPKTLRKFGDTRVDNYFWMRDKSDRRVINHLKSENAYTDAQMKGTVRLQKRLYKEILRRIKETDTTLPYKKGGYYYYSKTKKGKQYRIIFRKKSLSSKSEEKLLDENKLARGHSFFALNAFEVSPNDKLLAYSTNTVGTDSYTLFIKDLETGKILVQIKNTDDIVWANNEVFFYTTLNKEYRSYRLYQHTLGTDPKQDRHIYQENDALFSLDLGESDDKKFIFFSSYSRTTTEVRFLPLSEPFGRFRIIEPRRKGIEYSVESHGDYFYILTNENAKNFRLMRTPKSNPSRTSWRDFLPHRKAVKLEYFKLFKDYIVIAELEDALQRIRVIRFEDGSDHEIKLPESVYSVYLDHNEQFNTNVLRLNYGSFVTPLSTFDYNMDTRTLRLMKQAKVKDYDKSKYTSERIFARAKDNEMVPILIVHKKGIAKNGKNPLLLEAYGSYGANSFPYFWAALPSLLDRGFIYALALIRGGGEKGRYWYDEGKLLKKKNTFKDFIAASQFLISKRYTSSEDLVMYGGSAGGLLVGAVLNMGPDVFRGALADVPFVDILTTMLDPSLPLTIGEYEEWGNPNEKRYYEYIKSYSPYDNVSARSYPSMLVTTSLNDTRVPYWEAAKWVAKLRDMKTDDNKILLKVNLSAGHSSASGRYDALKEWALKYAFLFDLLEIRK